MNCEPNPTAPSASNHPGSSPPRTLDQFPVLAALGLTVEDLDILATGGKIDGLKKPPQGIYWRLRFCRLGKRITIYMGRGLDPVTQVREELDRLQKPWRQARACRQLARHVRRKFREHLAEMDALLKGTNYRVFDHVVRRRFGTPREVTADPVRPETGC